MSSETNRGLFTERNSLKEALLCQTKVKQESIELFGSKTDKSPPAQPPPHHLFWIFPDVCIVDGRELVVRPSNEAHMIGLSDPGVLLLLLFCCET
jgi:hypothetical protein